MTNLKLWHGGRWETKKGKTTYVDGQLLMVERIEELCYFIISGIIRDELGYNGLGKIYFKKRGLCLHRG